MEEASEDLAAIMKDLAGVKEAVDGQIQVGMLPDRRRNRQGDARF